MARPEKIRLGEILTQQKLVSQEQLKFGLDEQKRTGRKLGRVLIENGFVTGEKISEALARQLNIPYINLKYYNVKPEIIRRLPETQARRFRAIVLEERNGALLVGMADPTDLFGYDEISRILKRDLDLAVVSEADLLQTIDRVYRRTEEITGLARALEEDVGENIVDFGTLGANLSIEEAPVVKLLQSVFEDAAQVRASDIHFEPQEKRLHIRFRIDGMLHLQAEADNKISSAVVLRLKLMSGLDISEKRLPQDGRFNVKVQNKQIDVRLSCMPSQFGETVVMRLLDQSTGPLALDSLGMSRDMLERFKAIIHRTNGMILVTGPTGSGKTTTLYSALSLLNTPDRKIITVEDPVEYRLAGVMQVQTNEKIDLTFTRVLRSVLRQDPDVILIGEMRDAETAQIGVRASITGHMVLSTLHTRDAVSTPIRLVDMGIPKYMISTSVHAVLAQRLIRVICESCVADYELSADEAMWFRAEVEDASAPGKLKYGRGCSNCNGSGYQGRTAIYEMLEMTATLVEAMHNDDPGVFAKAAYNQMRGQTLRHNSLKLALEGKTTVAEVMRITSQIED